ncbi:MAG: undecaprenyl/decaprenyl-phosphate alpha-N-acetylglucosaminyl 1-phosphate transferase [Phycisphaerales bacterium]|nr:undecaprenyl/decaprenyl-phosphate alpha-N-acetylglucosaminyl 1-phosphate transferase [Phycisphaerales bacterium]
MTRLVLGLIPLAFLLAWPLTVIVRRISASLGAMDAAGVEGQVKAAPRRVPNTGGVAIFLAIAAPIVLGLWFLAPMGASSDTEWQEEPGLIPVDLYEHLPRLAHSADTALLLVGCLAALHVLGLIDDRRPLGPFVKLGVMTAVAAAVPLLSPETRMLTMLDAHAGGSWLSIALTVLWLLVVTNAMNFMDNMDGLTAGTAGIASACFLAAAILHQQWFVGACLALLVGACAGFLVLNYPPAKIFMGDGGSLVIGFLLGFLTIRTTYVPDAFAGMLAGRWYGVFMPLCVLAVPIYDFVSVVVIRLSQGRSPFVGDMQHLSHRLVGMGLSKRASVMVIWGLTLVTGISGIVLGGLAPWQAALVGGQVLVILGLIAAFEFARSRGTSA